MYVAAASTLEAAGVASPPGSPQPMTADIANSETTTAPILCINEAPQDSPCQCNVVNFDPRLSERIDGERASYGRMNARVIDVPSSFPSHSHCSNAFPMSSIAKLCDITSVKGNRPRVRTKKSSATGSERGW